MTQTLALLVDAYRELNARRMFWITLILSGLVVGVFALIGLTEKGVKIIVWEVDVVFLNTSIMSPETFYKTMFTTLGIGFWLAWIATILALVSTASIFPEFISSGSIDLALSKPIGRLRLFITKYLTGLLFVALQVSIFSLASFLVIGLKGGAWEPGLFLAIPLLVCFFSYLFAVCVVLGLVTRSTIAALLLTLLIWAGIFALHFTESLLLFPVVQKELQVEQLREDVASREEVIAQLPPVAEGESDPRRDVLTNMLDERRTRLVESEQSLQTWSRVHTGLLAAKTVLPKTSETAGLIERWLIDLNEMPAAPEDTSGNDTLAGADPTIQVDPNELQRAIVERTRERSPWWIIGTSLLFELILLSFGAWRFCRRDF